LFLQIIQYKNPPIIYRYRLYHKIMPKISYVCFPHLFVGFEHDYINTKQRETNTRARSQAMTLQRHFGTSLIR